MESYHYIRNARQDYEYLLKRFSGYSPVQGNRAIHFDYLSRQDDEQLMKLYSDYSLARHQRRNDEVETFLNVLRWSHEILLYYKQKDYDGPENATSIIAFSKDEKAAVNCRQHAIVLTEALLSMGYEARVVSCQPIDVLPYDSHAITAAYSHKLAKWLALDPARNCYYVNNEGRMLSIAEIRQCLIQNEKISFKYLHRFSRLGTASKLVEFDDDWYLDYIYKNFFRFYCNQVNGTMDQVPQRFYHLVPSGYSEVNKERFLYNDAPSAKAIMRMDTDDWESFWAKPSGKAKGGN